MNLPWFGPPQDRYSNFIYGFASKEELFILDSVSSTVVHLATGTSHISSLEYLYGESGESPLFAEESFGLYLRGRVENNLVTPLML
jgi:hypothetical protein